ncbi:acetyltransferase, GNAT family protein [Cryptosporidium felis]|nr:acetyltransferase, GNAT family protein [Cryptosporidium felis]
MTGNNPYGGYDLVIREFEPSDSDGVRRVCFKHFRSLTFPSVFFYLSQHLADMIALLVIGKIFMDFKQLVSMLVLFGVYLTGRSIWEVETYIRNCCTDLRNVHELYMISPGYHFWVAELVKRRNSLRKRRSVILNGSNGVSLRAEGLEQNDCGSKNTECEETQGSKAECGDSILVGCVGLAPYRDDPKIGRLVRLVVGVESRRMRIGTRLLAQMENFAKEYGYKEIHLYTNNLSTSPIKFISQHGYQLVQVISRGLMRGDLLLWRKSFEKTGSDNSYLNNERNSIGERVILD